MAPPDASPGGPGDAGADAPLVRVRALAMRHGGRLIQQGLSFDIRPREVLVIAGPSGCGKSTLLRHLIGLQWPEEGSVHYGGEDLHRADEAVARELRQRFGVMFQSGALWSSMTVAENLLLPLQMHRAVDPAEGLRRARYKLALVGLEGAADRMPGELSGGMRKRAAIARALMLDPPLLYLDEPSAGLDPVNSGRLDELVLQLRDHLGTTVVMVTHEIDSVFAVADRMLFLDPQQRTMTALDAPCTLAEHGPPAVRAFLHRGRT